jgi:Flp pilus assembly protein TadD
MSEKSEELYDQALDLLQEGKLKEGIAAIENSLMEDAKDAMTWRLYGIALTSAGRVEDAAAAMEKAETFGLDPIEGLLMKAVGLGPEQAQAWYTRGRVLRLTKDSANALSAFTKAVALAPRMPVAWHEQGMAQVDIEDFEAAAVSFERVLELQPGDAAATQGLAIVHERLS